MGIITSEVWTGECSDVSNHSYYRETVATLVKVLCGMFLFTVLTLTVHKTRNVYFGLRN